MNKLNEIPNKNPFKVPENYFEDINRKILNSTTGKEEGGRKVFKIRFRSYMAIAASVAGFIIIAYTAFRLFIPPANEQLSEISGENIELFINDIDITFLENAVTSEMTGLAAEMKNDELIEYLLREDVEINEIYERL